MCRRFETYGRATVARLAEQVGCALAAEVAEHPESARALAALDPLPSFRATLAQPADAAAAAGGPHAPAASSPRLFDPPAAPAPGAAERFPGSVVALIAPTGTASQLAIVDLVWGFDVPWQAAPVFNTRIETLLGRADSMWADAFAHRRCVVAARSFYETHARERTRSPKTGRLVRRPYAFSRPDAAPLFLAGLHEQGRFSLVTVPANATVAPVHARMPLALDARGAARWLAGDVAELRRDMVPLAAAPEGALVDRDAPDAGAARTRA